MKKKLVYVNKMREDYDRKTADVFGVIKQHMLICGDYLLIDVDGKHWCPLSAEFIAKKTGYSIRTVVRAIKKLRDKWLAETKLKYIRRDGKRVNYFSITQNGANYLTTRERKELNLLYEWENKEEIIQKEIIKHTESLKILSAEERALQKSEKDKMTDINIRVNNNHIIKNEGEEEKVENLQPVTEPAEKIETN